MTDTSSITKALLTHAIIRYDDGDKDKPVTIWNYDAFTEARNFTRANLILAELGGEAHTNFIQYGAYRIAFEEKRAVLGSSTTIPSCGHAHKDKTQVCPKCGYYHEVSFTFTPSPRNMTREQYNKMWLERAKNVPKKDDVPDSPGNKIDFGEYDHYAGD